MFQVILKTIKGDCIQLTDCVRGNMNSIDKTRGRSPTVEQAVISLYENKLKKELLRIPATSKLSISIIFDISTCPRNVSFSANITQQATPYDLINTIEVNHLLLIHSLGYKAIFIL